MKTQEFKNKIKEKLGTDYEVLGNYVNNKTYILMKHLTCGHEWECLPMTLTRKKPTRCPECFGTPKKTTEQFKKEVFDLVESEYTVLGDYISNSKKILMKHNKCGREYNVTPKDFKHGYRCPECFGTPKKTTEQFKKEVFDIVQDDYLVLGEYTGTNNKILMQHTVCGYEWEVKPNNFLNRQTRCPLCVNTKESKGVNKIKDFLEENNFKYEIEKKFNTCKNKRELPFDFYVPELNLLIEFDGEQHFQNNRRIAEDVFKLSQKRDGIKNKWVKENKISLLRIDYTNLKNIEKILNGILIEKSATTIENYNLYIISEDSLFINDNNKYSE